MSQIIPLKSSRSLELWLLLGLAFFLPLFEAPKNLLWLAYVVVWLTNRWRAKEWGGRWDRWDTLIAAWIGAGYVVAFFAATHNSEWQGAADTLRYASVLWCMKRSRYSPTDLAQLGVMVLTGCAVTLAWGFWRHYITHERFYVELNSVGAVNHSTIYLAICAMFALSWLFASWSRWGASRRLATSMLLLFFLVGLFIESSRGAIGATFVAIVVVAAAWRRRSRVPLAILSISLIVGLLAAVTGNVEVVEKQRAGMQSGDYLSKRGSVWNRAVVAWQAHPWFGVGIDNFAMIDDDMLRRQVERNGGNYVRENYSGTNHAHNLYLNTLAERGVFGFSVLALAFASWAAMLLRSRPPPEAADIHWLYWSSSVSAWIIIAGAGMFNTTFHHEISLLALLILGGWMSLKRQPQA